MTKSRAEWEAMRSKIGTVMALAALCSGCSGVSITRVTTIDQPLTGVPWNLSMTQFSISTTRQITACEGKLEGTVTATAFAKKAADPQQKYMLDATGIWATSDLAASMAADGTSLGLNAASQDQTAQVIGSILTVAAQVAPLAAGAELAARPASIHCSKEVAAAFQDMNPKGKSSLKQQVGTETQKLTQATNEVSVLTAQAQNSASYKAALARALGEQAQAQAALAKDQDRFVADMKSISETVSVTWPLSADEFRTKMPFVLSDKTLRSWISVPAGLADSALPDKSLFNLSLAIYRADREGGWTQPPPPARGDTTVGVPVRFAAPGRLLACSGASECRPETLPPDWVAPNTGVQTADQAMLQLGQLINVRVRGGIFKSEAASIVLDAQGQPSSIEVKETASAASTAATAMQGAATAIAGIPNAISAMRLASAQALSAEIAAKNAQIQYQANLPTAGATARTQAQTTYMQAQVALATAQANLQYATPQSAATAQANMITALNSLNALQANAPYLPQVSVVQDQTTLLTAQAAQLNAQASLATAQAAAQ